MAVTRAGRRPATPAAAAAGDAAATALFVAFSSLWGEATARLAPAAGISPFIAGLAVLAAGLVAFDPVARAVGAAAAGAPAIFNPAHTLALAVAGRGGLSLKTAVTRSVGQVVGGLGAALAAATVLPKHALPTPSVPGALRTAILAELGLGAALATAVVFTASSSRVKAVGVPVAVVVALTFVGAEFISYAPAFNPAVAAAWAWRAPTDIVRHAAAYWAAPLAGGAVAGVLWRVLDESEGKRKGKGAGKARAARAASQRKKRA